MSRECFQRAGAYSGQVPPGHVVIKFIYPDFGATITHESALILKDRTLVVGDVVKRKSSDAESGMVIKTSTSCTLEPIYNDLPYHGSEPWEHLPQDNLLQVPTEDVQFIDYEPGDRIIYQNWMGEIEDVFEEVSVRLGNGTVVKVHDPDALEIPECVHREVFTNPPPLITALRIGRQRRGGIVSTSNKDETTGPPSSLYPGQSVLTTKANLRLGHWLIGSYTPSEPPRGIVVDVKVSSIKVVWVATKLYEMPSRDFMLPPEVLEFPELDEVRLYNKYNLTSTAENTSNQFGSRHGHDVSVGDVVKFRDVAGAAVKYSEQSLNRDQTGVFRRIPRIATQGFDMNTFRIANTDTHARIQWQSGQITKEDSNKVVPYINVDDHDVWIGEIVSLKSAEEKRGGLVYLKEIGVVQSVDADERIAKVRWFDNLVVSIFEDRPSTLVSEVSAGQISNRESSVALFDIAAYPALTKRRGDLVVLAPNDSLLGAAGMEFPTDVAQAMQMGHSLPLPFGPTGRLVHDPQNILSNALVRWFGEVVDLGLDGQLTVRLGALDRPEDIKVSIQRVAVAVSSDDYDSESDAASEDYFTESMSGDDEQLPISETIEYPDGQQMDSGAEEDWVTDEEDHDDPKRNDLKDKEPCVDRDGDVEMKDSTVGPEPADSAQKADNAQSDGAEPISNVAQGANEFLKQPSTQYRFAQLSNTPLQFEILEGDAPSSHHYASSETRFSSTFLRRVRKEHAMLENNLPDGIWIRTWDERLDLLRVLILGPQGTPYQSAPFLLDFKLEHDFPTSPPKVYFHSWTYGVGRINPNLYQGKSANLYPFPLG